MGKATSAALHAADRRKQLTRKDARRHRMSRPRTCLVPDDSAWFHRLRLATCIVTEDYSKSRRVTRSTLSKAGLAGEAKCETLSS